jgi:streptogramin lyase
MRLKSLFRVALCLAPVSAFFTAAAGADSPSFSTFPGPSGGINQLSSGPNGNVWFTENTDEIGYVEPDGSLVQFTIPDSTSQPTSLTEGSDGNIWFSDQNHLWSVTPSGTFTSYPQDPAGTDLVTGGDGRVWYIANNTTVAAVDTAGTLTDFGIEDHGTASALSVDATGHVWLYESVDTGERNDMEVVPVSSTGFPTPTGGYPNGGISGTPVFLTDDCPQANESAGTCGDQFIQFFAGLPIYQWQWLAEVPVVDSPPEYYTSSGIGTPDGSGALAALGSLGWPTITAGGKEPDYGGSLQAPVPVSSSFSIGTQGDEYSAFAWAGGALDYNLVNASGSYTGTIQGFTGSLRSGSGAGAVDGTNNLWLVSQDSSLVELPALAPANSPPVATPETSLPVVLPVAGAALGGIILVVRRRRWSDVRRLSASLSKEVGPLG